jgi:hypothetical protein
LLANETAAGETIVVFLAAMIGVGTSTFVNVGPLAAGLLPSTGVSTRLLATP